MFSAGNLVVVNTQRVVLNSRIWTVTDIKRTDGRVVLSSADGLLSDVGAVKHIAVFAENVTHLAVACMCVVEVVPMPLATEPCPARTSSGQHAQAALIAC